MKRYSLIGLLLILAAVAVSAAVIEVPEAPARMTAVVVGGGGGASSATYACDSPSDADIACEDFMGSTDCKTGDSKCRIAWTDGTETGGTIAVGSISAGNTCTDAGTYSLVIAKTNNTTLEDLGIYKAITGDADLWFSFMVKIGSSTSSTVSSTPFVTFFDNTTSWHNVLVVGPRSNGSGNHVICAGTLVDNGSCGSTLLGTTWHRIDVHVVQNSTSYVYLDGSVSAETSTTAANYATGVISLGTYDTNYNYSHEFATLKADTNAKPTPCGT